MRKFIDILKEEAEPEIDEYGNKRYRLNGILHRDNGPAVEMVNGTQIWMKDGSVHREDGPAIITNDKREYVFNDRSYPFIQWLNKTNRLNGRNKDFIIKELLHAIKSDCSWVGQTIRMLQQDYNLAWPELRIMKKSLRV